MYLVNAFWTIADGCEAAAHAALAALAADVEAHEPDTWMYLVHDPDLDPGVDIFPPPTSRQVGFVEGYKDRAAFAAHGRRLAGFLAEHGGLFLHVYGPTCPFMTLQSLLPEAGFIRHAAAAPDVFQVVAR